MLIHSVQQPQQAVMSSSILINLQRLKGGLSSELFAYRRCKYSAEISGNAEKKKMQNKQQTSKDATAVLETIPLQS